MYHNRGNVTRTFHSLSLLSHTALPRPNGIHSGEMRREIGMRCIRTMSCLVCTSVSIIYFCSRISKLIMHIRREKRELFHPVYYSYQVLDTSPFMFSSG